MVSLPSFLLLFASLNAFAGEPLNILPEAQTRGLFQRIDAVKTGTYADTCAKKDTLINDSLVKNLSCRDLRPDNVLLSLQKDAFSRE